MGPPSHLKNIHSELLMSKGNAGTKSGAETEGKAIQPALRTPKPDTIADDKKHFADRRPCILKGVRRVIRVDEMEGKIIL